MGSVHINMAGEDPLPPQVVETPITHDELGIAMDELQVLLGDGEAKVTTSLGMKESDYGNGYDAHVSVTLSCAQDEIAIRHAYEHASEIAAQFCQELFERGQTMYLAAQKSRR
tara:strand:+ start:232 stop:570 length:339 start_codon:yes stop_codon:yes gene_type:complete